MTAAEMAKYIGKAGVLYGSGSNTLTVGIRVLDVRIRFGHVDFLVEPLSGSGRLWVQEDRCKLDD